MHLAHPFYKFLFQFDANRLRAGNRGHPGDRPGVNTMKALRGIPLSPSSPLTVLDNDTVDLADAADTAPLRSPYMMQILAQFRTLLAVRD